MKALSLISLLLIAPVSADELEVDLTGQKSDGTIVTGKFDIDTSTAILDPTFITQGGHQYMITMTGTFDYTNYTLSDGEVTGASGTDGVNMITEGASGGRETVEFFQGPGDLMWHTSLPAYTLAQYNALNDPFAALLLGATWNGPNDQPVSFYTNGIDGGGLGVGDTYNYYYGTVKDLTTTSVPEPETWALFPMGFILLWLNRRRTGNERRSTRG